MRDARLRESAPRSSGHFCNTPAASIHVGPDTVLSGVAPVVAFGRLGRHHPPMIIAHTQNANGARRVYLNGKGSVECYIEPAADNRAWSFHLGQAVAGNLLTEDELRAWAIHTLMELSAELNVVPEELKAVPFECIAALHQTDPFAARRLATPRRRVAEQCFMATVPNVGNRPRSDYRAEECFAGRQNRRSD